MQPSQRLRVAAAAFAVVSQLLGVLAVPQGDLLNHISQHGEAEKAGPFNVFFIPAYRLTSNRTSSGTAPADPAVPAPAPAATPTVGFDPQTRARLVGAALAAALRNGSPARLTSSTTPPPPSHTTPAPTLPPPAAAPSSHLVRRAPETLPPQNHDAHILVTLQNYGQHGAASVPATGHGSVQHFNNYPAVNGHVPSHFGHLPYYGHFPAAPPTSLLYPGLPSAAASALNLVSSSPLAVNPGTLLGTTGPVYASPGHPASTLGSLRGFGDLGTLGPAGSLARLETPLVSPDASSAQDTTATVAAPGTTTTTTTTTSMTVTEASTTTVPPTMPAATTPAAETLPAEARGDPKDDAVTTPLVQTYEFGRAASSKRLNLTEEVEVAGGESTTAPPPTASTQQTSPATASEVKDLTAGQTPSPPASSETPNSPPYPFQQPGPPFSSVSPLGGYSPPGYHYQNIPHPTVDPFRDPRFSYKQNPQQQPAISRNPNNPNFPGNYNPFYGGYIPGFAPGYPFGVPPHGGDQRVAGPFGVRPPPFGPQGNAYGPFPNGGGVRGAGGPTGGGAGGSTGGSTGGGAGGSSQEASEEGSDSKSEGPTPPRLQLPTGPTGSGEDLAGRQPFRQQPPPPFPAFGGQLQQGQLQQGQLQQGQPPFSSPGLQAAGFPTSGFPTSGLQSPGFPPGSALYRPFGQQASGQGGSQVSPFTANYNQLPSEDFLGRQRLQALYPGQQGQPGSASLGQGLNQGFNQGINPSFNPGLSRGLNQGLLSPNPGLNRGLSSQFAGLDGSRGLFGQSFGSPFFAGDAEPRQSKVVAFSSPADDKTDVSGADDVLLSSVPSSSHHLQRRESKRTAPRLGFYSI